MLGGDAFGFGVEALGDVDGDGTPDVAVGAPGDNGEEGGNEGSFYVLFLESDGTVRASEKYLPGTGPLAVPDSELAIDIAHLGDLDGDGVVDLAVGAPLFHEKDKPKTGTVWVVFLNADGAVKSTVRVDDVGSGFDGDLDKNDWFGDGVAGIGDLDGDGVMDLVHLWGDGSLVATSGRSARALWQVKLDSGYRCTGARPAGADLDGDGTEDLLASPSRS